MVGPDLESWLDAMRFELKYMDENQDWNFIDLLDGVEVVHRK